MSSAIIKTPSLITPAEMPHNLATARFADVVIPLEREMDYGSGQIPTLKNFFDPASNRGVMSCPVPDYLMEDVLTLRQELLGRFAPKTHVKTFFMYDERNYRLSTTNDVTRGWYMSCRRVASPLPEFTSIKGINPLASRALFDLISSGRGGLVLFGGKSGVGKTTTMFSVFRDCLRRFGGTGYAVENPPEVPISGFHGLGEAFQIDAADRTMAIEMAEVRRKGAQYLIAGEIQFEDEAVEAVQAGLDGHVVFATGHGSNIITTLERLISTLSAKMSPDMARSNLAESLLAVVHQSKGRFETEGWTFSSEVLLVDDGSPIVGNIKGGSMSQIRDTIISQANLMRAGRSPVGRGNV